MILVFRLNDSQHVTDADNSVETIQSTMTSTDITGIDQETRYTLTENFAFRCGLTRGWPAIEGNSGGSYSIIAQQLPGRQVSSSDYNFSAP